MSGERGGGQREIRTHGERKNCSLNIDQGGEEAGAVLVKGKKIGDEDTAWQ